MHSPTPSFSDSLNATLQAAGQKTKDTIDYVTSNQKEATILAGAAAVLYLASRVAGFKAGYEFATKNH